nr:MAG TPA: helix-turn-helix domain protein [Caudoviricetes sp.]
MELSERVKALRKSNNLSQTEFAKTLGVTRGVIVNIEKGRLSSLDTKIPLLNLMCDKYGCRREWLIDGEGEMMQDLSREQEIIRAVSEMFTGDDSFKQDIISMLVKLPDEHWELLKDMAQRLLDEQKKERQG